MTSYWQRLTELTAARGALCLNIDPHPAILESWGLPVTAAGAEQCARTLVSVLGSRVAVFKPQSALFERYGSAGVAVLERVLADISAVGAISILDIKRGDIGSTMMAYADAYLVDGSPLAADAITVSPFLGFGSLAPAFEAAHRYHRGVYVLARTSNPEGASIQLARTAGGSVAQSIIDEATRLNSESQCNAIGLVIGGTHATLGCDLSNFNGSILVPGIGFQGGRLADLPETFGNRLRQVLPAVGRDIITAGPTPATLLSRAADFLD